MGAALGYRLPDDPSFERIVSVVGPQDPMTIVQTQLLLRPGASDEEIREALETATKRMTWADSRRY
jgi:alkylhydroperoxidase/carboxymuconolactone decarboxylase family protein YurZ